MHKGENQDADMEIDLKGAPKENETSAPVTSRGGPSVRIAITHEVAEEIDRFAVADTSREVGGILLGRVYGDINEKIVIVEGQVPAKFTASHQGSVTFTHESWDQMHLDRERLYPELDIVGWFHTHPGFGIFLSEYDLFIHRNFFKPDWQVAYVVDPKAHTHGWFCWEGNRIVRSSDFICVGSQFLSEYEDMRWAIDDHENQLRKNRRLVLFLRIFAVVCLILMAFGVWQIPKLVEKRARETIGVQQQRQLSELKEELQRCSQQLSDCKVISTEKKTNQELQKPEPFSNQGKPLQQQVPKTPNGSNKP